MMNSREMKQAMDRRLGAVVLQPGQRERILQAANATSAAQQAERKPPIRFKRVAVSMLAACLALVFCVAAAATAFPSFELLLDNMGRDLRLMLSPVCTVVESSGIRMEVVAAVNDGDSAIVFMTLQDMDGHRIDSNTELYDLKTSDAMFSHASVAHFDAKTETATLRLETDLGAGAQPQGKMMLDVGSILSGMQIETYDDLGVSVAEIRGLAAKPETTDVEPGAARFTPGASQQANEQLRESIMPQPDEEGPQPVEVLQPGAMPLELEVDAEFTVSNAGIVDDYLHVQQKPQGDEIYSHNQLYIEYPGREDEPLLAAGTVNFGQEQQEGVHTLYEYTEHVLELPKDVDEQQVRLAMWELSYAYHIEGDWEVTFLLDEAPPALEAMCELDMNPWVLYKVTVSPVGVTIFGRGETREDSIHPEVSVVLRDGSSVEYSGSTTWMEDGEDGFKIKNCFNLPVELDDVAYVSINGEIIRLSK